MKRHLSPAVLIALLGLIGTFYAAINDFDPAALIVPVVTIILATSALRSSSHLPSFGTVAVIGGLSTLIALMYSQLATAVLIGVLTVALVFALSGVSTNRNPVAH